MQSPALGKEGSLGRTEWVGDSSAENPWGDLMGITVAMSQQCIPAVKKSNRVLDCMNKCRTSRLMEVIALYLAH